MGIVLDTNVLVSAVMWDGNVEMVLQSCLEGVHTLLTSSQLLAELEDVLLRKFGKSPAEVEKILAAVRSAGELQVPYESLAVVHEDPDDDHVLECAVAGHADVIVTGDKHLLRLGEFRGIRIVRAADLLG